MNVQLEKRVRNLEHQDMWVTMIMHNEDSFDGTTHTKILIVVLKALQSRRHGRILLRLRFFCARVYDLGSEGSACARNTTAHLKVKFERGYL